jgi:phosphate transport system permease protein
MNGEMKSRGIWQSGDPFIWVTGGALIFSLLMIGGLLALIMVKGLGFFWPADLQQIRTAGGDVQLGQFAGREVIPEEKGGTPAYRVRMKIANRDLYGLDFRWFREDEIVSSLRPEKAVLLERREWGNFHGFLKEIRSGEDVAATGEKAWTLLLEKLPEVHNIRKAIRKIEVREIGRINHRLKKHREELGALKEGGSSAGRQAIEEKIASVEADYLNREAELEELYLVLGRYRIVMAAADGTGKVLSLGDVVRAYRPNSMSRVQKVGLYGRKLWEFMADYPRESNTEGGVFPAIFGTVMMVLIMTVAVMPFGVVAAVYLREYAKQGPLVRLVRISVNNLAGVPSIVFGVFGLGFFIYGIGGTMDKLFFSEALPTPTYGTGGILWASLTLALLTLPVVIVSAEEGLAAVPRDIRHGSLALGANKFETLLKVVIPGAAPGSQYSASTW